MVDDDIDSESILGMLGDPNFGMPPATTSAASNEGTVPAPDNSMSTGLDDIWPPPPGSQNDGSHGWAMPPEDTIEVQSSRLGTLDRAIPELEEAYDVDAPASDLDDLRATQQEQPAFASEQDGLGMPPDSVASAELGWRIKLASGLVLSFPTIDMVTAWSKDKSPDSVQISYGSEDFVSYGGFRERLEQMGDSVDAFYARGRVTPPPGEAGSASPALVADSERLEDLADPDFDADEDFVPDPAAIAAAAARDRPNTEKLYERRYQFRTAPEPSGPSRAMMALGGIGVLAVVVALLVWQGIL